MSDTPRALVIRTAGTNCDAEMARAFALAGAVPELIHLDRIVADPAILERFDLIGFPGGFSYGDDIASGRVLAMRVRERLYDHLREAILRGTPIIGVCNGFQALTQIGLLPGPMGQGDPVDLWRRADTSRQRVALADNASARFIDRWVRVEPADASRCVWTRGLWAGDRDDALAVMRLPVAHGEGRFVADSPETLAALEAGGHVALRYAEEVNGSEGGIAGICDATGLVFGLMPHPERYTQWTLHPFWTRIDPRVRRHTTPGLRMFENAVAAAQPAQPIH